MVGGLLVLALALGLRGEPAHRAALVVGGLRALPHPAAREREPLPDLVGAALVTVAVAALAGALVQAPVWGWTIAGHVGLLAARGAGRVLVPPALAAPRVRCSS